MLFFENIFQEHRTIITNLDFVINIKLFEQGLNQEPSLTGSVPLIRFHVGKEVFGVFGHLLNTKGNHQVIIKKFDNTFDLKLRLLGMNEIGDEHLCGSEHASPSGVRGVVGSGFNGQNS